MDFNIVLVWHKNGDSLVRLLPQLYGIGPCIVINFEVTATVDIRESYVIKCERVQKVGRVLYCTFDFEISLLPKKNLI